jgi:hypothetical protein
MRLKVASSSKAIRATSINTIGISFIYFSLSCLPVNDWWRCGQVVREFLV